MRTLAIAFLLGSAILAGCSSNSDGSDDPPVDDSNYGPGFVPLAFDAGGLPVPIPLCHPGLDGNATRRCAFEMTPDEGRQGNEVTIAVNPMDPKNVVGGAKDYYPADAGQCVWDGIYVTHDGAATPYEDRSFDGSPWRLTTDPTTFSPNYASSFWCTTDPVAYFDVNGNLYYLLMAYQTDPVTGSKTGEDELPQGALNDWAFNRATQIVAISADGGDTFHTFTPVLEGSYPVSFHDKGWIAAGADGIIHVMWLASLAPGNMYFRSVDGGKTYLEPEVLATVADTAGQGSFIDVGTGRQVYAIWTSDAVHMRRSMDSGATWDDDRPILSPNDATMPGLSQRDRRGGFPAMAADRNPESPYADALYIVWQDSCNDEAWSSGCSGEGSGIYVSASFDQGETWSAPARVSDASPHWRIFPAVSVSPGGVVDVSWMESTDLTIPASDGVDEHPALTQKYAYSLDGGATWGRPADTRDATDGGWDPALCHHQNGMIFIGDYNDIDSSWQAGHPVWPDSRAGVCDVYTATLQRPMFAEGWDDDSREAAEAFIVAHPLG